MRPKEIRAKLLAIHRKLIENRIKYHNAYQPISIGSTLSRKSIRNCHDRWNIIENVIRENDAKSVLDIGCAEGFFVRKSGELGCFSIGIDRDYNRLGLIESARMFDKSEFSGFALAEITPSSLKKVPVFDVVLCFSIMHHIIKSNNLEYAVDCLKEIRRITKSVLLFDMGQTNEISTKWSQILPNMGGDPKIWIENFLKEGGFKEVSLVGETDAYKDDVSRFVFLCRP